MTPFDGFRLASYKIDDFFIKQKMDIFEFRNKIEQLIQEYTFSETKPNVPISMPIRGLKKTSVFISYAHENKKWRDYILERLAPYNNFGHLTYWADTKIKGGEEWEKAIKMAIELAKVSILIVSNAFLSSKFIKDVEIPLILQRKRECQSDVIWFCIEKCPFGLIKELRTIQAAHDPEDPLDKLTPAKRGAILASICQDILGLVKE